jgi:hypothetical protein
MISRRETMRPMIDMGAAGGVDPERLERGVGLQALRAGPGQYQVTGGREVHWVDLRSPWHPRCDCGDHLWRDRVCKHILAALLREGDPHVIAAVGALVRELRARTTPPPRFGRRLQPLGS